METPRVELLPLLTRVGDHREGDVAVGGRVAVSGEMLGGRGDAVRDRVVGRAGEEALVVAQRLLAVALHVVFGRHVVISDAAFRQHDADTEVIVITIGRVPLVNNIFAKARAILDAEPETDIVGEAGSVAEAAPLRAGVNKTNAEGHKHGQ